MFDLPNAKRVRRADLVRSVSPSEGSTASDNDDHATSNAALLARLNQSSLTVFDPSLTQPTSLAEPDVSPLKADDADEFAFRLFSSASQAPASEQPPQPTRIRLESPGSRDAPPGILRSRPLSFYRARPLDTKAQARIAAAAVDGEVVQARAQRQCPGLACPWRVTRIPRSGTLRTCEMGVGREATLILGHQLSKQLFGGTLEPAHIAIRKGKGRIGKKARIKRRAQRRQDEKKQTQIQAEQQQRREREEHALEKKRALNRKKQHKKREKRALEKAATVTVGD